MCLIHRLVEPGEVSRIEMRAAVAKSAARPGADGGCLIRGYLTTVTPRVERTRPVAAMGVTVAAVEAMVKEAMHLDRGCFGAVIVYEEPGGRRVVISRMMAND